MADEADVTRFLLTGHEDAVIGDRDDVGVEPDAYLVWVPVTITARPEVVYLTSTTPPRVLRLRPVHARIETGILRLIGGSASVNEEQTVTVTGNPFTLTYSGQTTANISSTATDTQVEAALVALSNLASGDVQVVGADGGPYTVWFQGTLAGTNVSQMTASNATIATVDQGADNAGVRLVAKTSVLGLGATPLLYDVAYGKGAINGEEVDFADQNFTFTAPTTDTPVDLTTVTRA